MSEQEPLIEDIRSFWNNRATLGPLAGTRDIIMKQLEMQAIAGFVRDGLSVLEVGCGNGLTAIDLARRFRVELVGLDYAHDMVAAAKDLAQGQDLKGSLRFQVGDVRDLSSYQGQFDLVYTERVLVNLTDWPTQARAIENILATLRDGGRFIMCENSQDGLNELNGWRERVGLYPIVPPWHNRYLRDDELRTLTPPGARLEGVHHFSSTYYFLSRVVNAWMAAQEGKEPEYEAPVNRLALRLPPIGPGGQGRIWVWVRGGPRPGA